MRFAFRYPVIARTRSPSRTGQGMAFSPSPAHCQTSFPSSSAYARTRFVPLVMTWVRPPKSVTSGVAQVEGSSRGIRQSSFPVRLSR